MRVIGATENLDASTTKFKTVGAVWVYKAGVLVLTVRNAADDADIGVITLPAGGHIITLGTGEGLRANDGTGTPIVASGF
tara:strand:+ start:283 stop:522 length:240 start_codon:yes stop_codon:yes gene_type:complete